jgi:hypothetical protein
MKAAFVVTGRPLTHKLSKISGWATAHGARERSVHDMTFMPTHP